MESQGYTPNIPKNILITGRPGIGKTTIVIKVVEAMKHQIRVGGFWTKEVRHERGRIGFQIITVYGEKGWLAKKGYDSPARVGAYGVCLEEIERLIFPSLQKALTEADLIVMDEIGKMELYHPAFAHWVLKCLDAPQPVLGVLQEAPLPFNKGVSQRRDVILLRVTVNNRDTLPLQIVDRLKRLVPAQ